MRESNRFTSGFRVLWFLHLVLIFWNSAISQFLLVGRVYLSLYSSSIFRCGEDGVGCEGHCVLQLALF